MHALDQTDRTAVLLRYFENKSLREVGQTLGTTDDAAQKRVSRAVERLREFFIKHGVTIGASGLIVVISANAVQAAPIGLNVAIATTAALAGTSTATTATVTATKAIIMTTLQKTLISATLVVAFGTGIYEARQTSRLRNQVQTVQQQQIEQIQQLSRERDDATNQLAALRNENERLNRNTAELLKLRGEVGVLRRQQREVERVATAAQSGRSRRSDETAAVLTAEPNRPPPFQLQFVLDQPGDDSEVVTNNSVNTGEATLNVRKTPLLDHTAINSVTVTTSASGTPQIDVELSETAREQFAQITKENIDKRLAIVMDGKVYSAPVIRSEISGGKLQISGTFTEEEARELATKINDAIGNR
jgi:preprotein translocase subunit SecD